jgi:hypothetical protein
VSIGSGLDTQGFLDRIRNDPTYLYEYDRYFGPQGYYAIQEKGIRASMGGGGGGGYIPDYSKLRELAKKQAEQQKAEAERDAEIAAKYNEERRASMGQGGDSSGTGFVERDNDAKELQYLLSQVDIGLEQQMEQYNMSERAARAAAANAAAARARAVAQANVDLEMLQWQRSGKAFDLLAESATRVADFHFVATGPGKGMYVGPNGVQLTPEMLAPLMGGG